MATPLSLMRSFHCVRKLHNLTACLPTLKWHRCSSTSQVVSALGGTETHESLAQQFSKASGSHHRRQICRTTEGSPLKQTDHNEALFYTISAEDQHRWLRRGLRPSHYSMMKAFNENCLMVRKPALELFGYLQKMNYDMPVIRYLLYGRPGVGKSSTMAHVMHYCGQQGWLVVHVPWAAFYNRYYRDVQPSVYQPGLLDQPLEAADWLAAFKLTNEPLLKQLNLQTENRYVWSKREVSEAGTPWLEVIEFGLTRTKYAADILGVILKEIRQQASAKRFKALVAIDGVNAFWSQTLIRKEGTATDKYQADSLSLVHQFKKMIRNDWSNGAVLCTVDRHAAYNKDPLTDLPANLLGKQGMELLDPFIPIHMSDYSEKEAASCLQYYAERHWIQNPNGMTEDGKKQLLFLSSMNPLELYRVTMVV